MHSAYLFGELPDGVMLRVKNQRNFKKKSMNYFGISILYNKNFSVYLGLQ